MERKHNQLKFGGLISVLVFVLLIGSGFTPMEQVKTLTLWSRHPVEELQSGLDAYNARLQAAGKPIQWKYEQVLPDEVEARLASGQPPDALGIDLVESPHLLASYSFVNLTERFNKLDYHDKINPKMLSLGKMDGSIYAVPVLADVSVLVYNRTLFRNAGLDPDHALDTWDDLRHAAQVLTRDGVVAGYGLWCGRGDWLMFTAIPFIWANGGNVLSADGTRAMLSDPKALEAVQFLTDMNLIDHSTSPSGTTKGCADDDFDLPDFEKGSIAIKPTGVVYAASYIQSHPELDPGVALFPGKTTDSKSSFIGGDLVAIPTQSTDPDEAWNLIESLLSADSQVDGLARAGYVPVRSDLTDNPVTIADPRFKVFVEALAVGDVPSTPMYSKLYAPLQAGMQAAFNGDEPVAEALAATNAQIQQILDQQQ